jgi:hypothetical protein
VRSDELQKSTIKVHRNKLSAVSLQQSAIGKPNFQK